MIGSLVTITLQQPYKNAAQTLGVAEQQVEEIRSPETRRSEAAEKVEGLERVGAALSAPKISGLAMRSDGYLIDGLKRNARVPLLLLHPSSVSPPLH